MTRSTFKHFSSLWLAVAGALWLGLWGGAAAAQERLWIQIEANATLAQSTDRARAYAELFDNLAGFRVGSGWYALSIGPYFDRGAAERLRTDLRQRGLVPFDAFVTDEAGYGQQFWPVGAAGALAPRSPAETAAAPADNARPPAPQPVAAPPAPQPPAEETLAEARRSEGQLDRDDRLLIQTALQWGGWYTLGLDGAFGPGTRRAMAAWQEAMNLEPTGVLTTRQRDMLIDNYRAEVAAIGLRRWRDDTAGIEIDLPLGLVAFDRYEPPFAHFASADDSGVQVLLISQAGNQATLFGLYEIMQTLQIVPVEGERSRRNNGFLLTGQNERLRSHTEVTLSNGQIKGWTLIWTPDQDDVIARVLPAMQGSFQPIPGVLADDAGAAPSAVARRDLIAGLEVRRPERSATGFYVDGNGAVLTASANVAQCERVTLDEVHDARVAVTDEALGVAVLRPVQPLAPVAQAEFAGSVPRLSSEVAVAGFSYQDILTRPIVTFGALADVTGLNGETVLRRLAMTVQPGDAGGPVFDDSGAVFGMLLPRDSRGGRILPEDVNFAVGVEGLLGVLARAGVQPRTAAAGGDATPEMLVRRANGMTVLVSCWN